MTWMSCSLQSEDERLHDQREREELEQNLRERDAAGTRKVIFMNNKVNWQFAHVYSF